MTAIYFVVFFTTLMYAHTLAFDRNLSPSLAPTFDAFLLGKMAVVVSLSQWISTVSRLFLSPVERFTCGRFSYTVATGDAFPSLRTII